MQSAVLATVIPSFLSPFVRPCARPSLTRWYPIQTNKRGITRSLLWGSKNTLVFWYQQRLGGRPSTWNVRWKWPIPSEKRQQAIYEVHTLPLSLPKGGSRSKFVICVNINQFKSNKLCYKVSLCENFQRQICSRTIPLSNGVYILAVNVTLEPNI